MTHGKDDLDPCTPEEEEFFKDLDNRLNGSGSTPAKPKEEAQVYSPRTNHGSHSYPVHRPLCP